MSKTVLILAYYFRPCTYVAANRPNFFADEFKKYGFNVIVITRHWTGKEQVWPDYISGSEQKEVTVTDDGITVHRLPYTQTVYSANPITRKGRTLLNHFNGVVNEDVNYYQFKEYVQEVLRSNNIDFVLASVPPLNILKLTHELRKIKPFKLLVDVRDFGNRIILEKNPQLKLEERVLHNLTVVNTRKWLKEAHLTFTVTPPITVFLQKLTTRPVITVMNGFDEKLLNINEALHHQFHITLIGSLYLIPELEEMLEGFRLLFRNEFAKKIKLQFIGTVTSSEIERLLKKNIPEENLVLQPRKAQVDALKEASRSHMLLVLGFKNQVGTLGTKPFEYMGLRRPIIQMPGDENLMQEFILGTKTGYCPSNAQEFVDVIRKHYLEWKNNGCLNIAGDVQKIVSFSRQSQFGSLLPYLE